MKERTHNLLKQSWKKDSKNNKIEFQPHEKRNPTNIKLQSKHVPEDQNVPNLQNSNPCEIKKIPKSPSLGLPKTLENPKILGLEPSKCLYTDIKFPKIPNLIPQNP